MSLRRKEFCVADSERIWYDYTRHTKDQSLVSFIEKGREK
jgi:hypothetical protein